MNNPKYPDWLNEVINHVAVTPPRCISDFQVAALHSSEKWENGVLWQLACSCGEKTGKVHGYTFEDIPDKILGPVLFGSPLAFECTKCGKTTEILDTASHGHDAELCDSSTYRRGEGPTQVYACPDCGKSHFVVAAYFSHSHFDDIEDDPELMPRSQDLFDCFSLDGTCSECGKKACMANFELA